MNRYQVHGLNSRPILGGPAFPGTSPRIREASPRILGLPSIRGGTRNPWGTSRFLGRARVRNATGPFPQGCFIWVLKAVRGNKGVRND